MSFYYAQINEENICVGISQLNGEVVQDNMIRLETLDNNILGKEYENFAWIDHISQLNIDTLKQNKITLSKTELSAWLQNNPILFADGKRYAVTQEKQNLLNNALAIYQLKTQVGMTDIELKWNSTGEECVSWTIENLVMLALSIASHVEPLIAHQQNLELQIKSCTTKAELDRIVVSYETVN